MKSKASLKSHPVHPILVSFPIALFISTFVFDILHFTSEDELYFRIAKLISTGGIAMAVLAAIPGFIDFLYTVPPKSSGKKRAAKHGLLNVTVLVLFSIAFFLRTEDGLVVVIILEALGVILLSIAGWLGGTLVYRNQIGVDPRYAEAGKWKEQSFDEAPEVEVGTTDELKVNQMKLIHVGGKRIVVARTGEGYRAFDDRCTHRGGSLAGGALICGTAQCPWHGSQFSAHDGKVSAGPATVRIATYELEERSGKLMLRMTTAS